MSIGQNIKRLRIERHFTQENVAEALDVTNQAVSSWEREEYQPELSKLMDMAELFDVSLSSIVEDRLNCFKTKEAIYNWEHMKTYVKTVAKYFSLINTLKAIDFSVETHEGQTRKRSDIPYIYHPLNLACHTLAMNIIDDEIIAACLLHDVVEDCGKSIDELPVSDTVKELVDMLTHIKTNDKNRNRVMKLYYDRISSDSKASLIKCIDRCNNLTSMSWELSRKRIIRMIKETDIYYPPLLKILKSTPEYNNAAWLLQYQIESMLDIYKRLM